MTYDVSSQLPFLHSQVISLALKAGEKIMDFYKSEELWLEKNEEFFSLKSDKTPVTLADKAADQLIVSALHALTPTIEILSEEGDHKLTQTNLVWVVDPLDGTRQFIKRKGHFTVNIALVKNGVPILGVIYEPLCNKLYSGYQNQLKPFVNFASKSNLTICHGSFTQRIDLLESLITCCFQKGFDIKTALISSSYKYCLVADNTFDIALSLHKMSSWDIAAAHAIILSLGGKLGIWHPQTSRLKPIDYLSIIKNNSPLPPGVMAFSATALQAFGFQDPLPSKPLW